jgi:ABC-type nitrate/sulfonate/bicarbonate transport system permease component
VIWYLAAYAVFWAVLFGYLMGVSNRQQMLVERAESLRVRLSEGASDAGGAA